MSTTPLRTEYLTGLRVQCSVGYNFILFQLRAPFIVYSANHHLLASDGLLSFDRDVFWNCPWEGLGSLGTCLGYFLKKTSVADPAAQRAGEGMVPLPPYPLLNLQRVWDTCVILDSGVFWNSPWRVRDLWVLDRLRGSVTPVTLTLPDTTLYQCVYLTAFRTGPRRSQVCIESV